MKATSVSHEAPRLLLIVLCALWLGVLATPSAALAQTYPIDDPAYGAPAEEEEFVDDDFFLFPFLLVMMGVAAAAFVVLLGIGLFIAGIFAALVAMGILATSTISGLLARSAKTGFRALFLQLGALGGTAIGMGICWVIQVFPKLSIPISPNNIYLQAGAAGLVGGLLVALLFNFAWERLARLLLAKAQQLPERMKGIRQNYTI